MSADMHLHIDLARLDPLERNGIGMRDGHGFSSFEKEAWRQSLSTVCRKCRKMCRSKAMQSDHIRALLPLVPAFRLRYSRGRRGMEGYMHNYSKLLSYAGLLAIAITTTTPARADFCLQLNGGPFSGDLGFFRFKDSLPTTAGAIAQLRGRVAGLDPVFGTAVVAKDGTYVEIGATFFADAEEGQIDVTLAPPTSKTGFGYGDYGAYGTGTSVTVTKTSCSGEP
jgi:hypothetical protein